MREKVHRDGLFGDCEMKKRICFLMHMDHEINSYLDLVRGCEIILYNYSQFLMKKGYEPIWVLLAKKDLKIPRVFHRIPLVRIERKFTSELNPINFVTLFLKLVKTLKKRNVEIVYTRVSSLGLIAGFACKITGSRFIFHVEDLEADLTKTLTLENSFWVYLRVFLLMLAQKGAVSMATVVITVSKTFKNFLVRNWRIPSVKVIPLYEGAERKPQLSSPSRNNFPISIVYLGGISEYDGLDVLLRAFQIVVRKYENLELVIATFAGEDKIASSRKMCTYLGLDKNVRFVSSITGQVARSLVRNSNIGVIPRRQTLSTNLTTSSVIFLYFSEGKPVVVPRLKAISELVSEEASFYEPGNFTSLADALIRLISDDRLREKLRIYSLKMRDDFSREKMCEKLVNIIKSL